MLHELRDDAPLGDVLPLELGILWGVRVKLSLLHDELRVSSHILCLSMLALHPLELVGLILSHALLLELERLICLGEQVSILISRHQSILVLIVKATRSCLHSVLELFAARLKPLLSHTLIVRQAHRSRL